MQAILASANAGKVTELNSLCAPTLQLTAAPQSLDVVEDGTSFQENALKKAKAYFEKFNEPALADDSGLVLKAFPQLLGVQTAHFAEQFPNYIDRCLKVLELFSENKESDRSAYFVCVLCLYLGPDEVFFFEGRCHGAISHEIIGSGGFGYDPIFRPEGSEFTFGERPEHKKTYGHRAKAVESLCMFLQK